GLLRVARNDDRASWTAGIWPACRRSRVTLSVIARSAAKRSRGSIPQSAARHALGRRVFEMQRLARIDQRVDRVRRQRCLGEARQDQLEFAGVGGDIADREDAGPRGGAGGRVDADVVVVEVEAPGGQRAEIGSEAKKR